MGKSYQKRCKRNSPSLLLIILGGLLVFVISMKTLATPVVEEITTPRLTEEESHEAFLERLAPHAQELQEGYGVLPSIILGQAVLESNWGQSTLASQYNNLFGIKAYGKQKKVKLETQEYVNEEWITIQGEFKVYDSWEESMDDHTMLFVNGVDWNPYLYEKVLTAANYKQAAKALQEAGYATDPTYADKIIGVIESYKLDQYDK